MAVTISDAAGVFDTSTSSAEAIAKDMGRVILSLTNLDTTNTIYLLFGSGTASATNCHLALGPGKGILLEGPNCPGDAIQAISSAGTPKLAIGVW